MNNRGKIGPYGKFIGVPDMITIYKYEDKLSLTYYSSKQDATNCIILSLSGEYITPKDYRIRFMDTQGNPLDKDILNDLDYIKADISYNYRGIVNIIHLDSLTNSFYEKMEDIIVSTALKRKTELLDFFDPQVWKDSEIETPKHTGDYETDYKMAYLREVQKKRVEEEDNPIKEVTKI